MGKGNITKLKRVGKTQVRNETEYEKEREDSSKWEIVNQKRDKVIDIKEKKKTQDDDSKEEMIIKKQRPDCSSMYPIPCWGLGGTRRKCLHLHQPSP